MHYIGKAKIRVSNSKPVKAPTGETHPVVLAMALDPNSFCFLIRVTY
jgi:hypothetical protein